MKPVHDINDASQRSVRHESTRSKPVRRLARQTSHTLLALGVALGVNSTVHAQTWETVDDIDAPNARVRGIAADSAGNLFAAGSMSDAAGILHAVIMKSSNQGNDWVTSDDIPSGMFTPIASRGNVTVSAGNTLPLLGLGQQGSWIIRGRIEGVDGGAETGRLGRCVPCVRHVRRC